MPYKKSRFNFTYRQSEDAYVVFNTYSKALVVLSSAEFEQFNAQHFDDSQMVRELADNGILVDETFDEIGFMTYCHNMTKFSRSKYKHRCPQAGCYMVWWRAAPVSRHCRIFGSKD